MLVWYFRCIVTLEHFRDTHESDDVDTAIKRANFDWILDCIEKATKATEWKTLVKSHIDKESLFIPEGLNLFHNSIPFEANKKALDELPFVKILAECQTDKYPKQYEVFKDILKDFRHSGEIKQGIPLQNNWHDKVSKDGFSLGVTFMSRIIKCLWVPYLSLHLWD